MYLLYRGEQIHSSMTANPEAWKGMIDQSMYKNSIKVLSIYFCYRYLSEKHSALTVTCNWPQSIWLQKRARAGGKRPLFKHHVGNSADTAFPRLGCRRGKKSTNIAYTQSVRTYPRQCAHTLYQAFPAHAHC